MSLDHLKRVLLHWFNRQEDQTISSENHFRFKAIWENDRLSEPHYGEDLMSVKRTARNEKR